MVLFKSRRGIIYNLSCRIEKTLLEAYRAEFGAFRGYIGVLK